MSLDRASEAYYTAAQARGRLGLTEAAFQGWVRDKKVRKIILPGSKQGVYARREIDTIAAGIDMAVLAMKEPELDFRRATLETQLDEFKLAELVFGERTEQFHPYRIKLLTKNPDMSYYLYDGQILVASINIVPLNHQGIELFLQGERGWLLGDYVEQFEPGKPLECIIIDMMTTPLVPANRRPEYALRLLMALVKHFVSWGERGIEIKSIHACGGTPDGQRILKTAGFRDLGEPRPNRRMYELLIADTKLKALEPYKHALSEWKRS